MIGNAALHHEASGTLHGLTPPCSDILSGVILPHAMESKAMGNVFANEALTQSKLI